MKQNNNKKKQKNLNKKYVFEIKCLIFSIISIISVAKMCQTSPTENHARPSDNPEDYEDRVSAIYNDKIILLTGGTGFVGKVLIEKLLRTCTGVKKIYLLIRTKKGKDPQDRLKDVFSNPVSSFFNVMSSFLFS